MERQRKRMVVEAKKIIDNINIMSLEKLDDEQLHSLMKMQEIARGIVNNRVRKVTEEDVQKELRSSINRMVGSCENVGNILNKIPSRGMDYEQKHSVSRMKEIVSNVVANKRAKLETIKPQKPAESKIVQVNEVDVENVESNAGVKDIGVEEIQTKLFENVNGVNVETVEAKARLEEIDVEEIETRLFENDTNNQPTTTDFEDRVISKINFKALGIPHPPSWSICFANGSKEIQVPRVPPGSVVEGLPLSLYLPEPHKSGFEYLLELIAALKHMISTSASIRVSRSSSRIRDRGDS